MSIQPVAANVKQLLGDGSKYRIQAASVAPSSSAPSQTAVSAAEALVVTDVATLVADGASPTQAHVTQLNTDWGTLKTALDAYLAAVTAYAGTVSGAVGDVTVTVNTANVTNSRQLDSALRHIRERIAGSSLVTP
jgi:hypothetical protein